jgi:hypothetical protein
VEGEVPFLGTFEGTVERHQIPDNEPSHSSPSWCEVCTISFLRTNKAAISSLMPPPATNAVVVRLLAFEIAYRRRLVARKKEGIGYPLSSAATAN